jgi:hypothetical protein
MVNLSKKGDSVKTKPYYFIFLSAMKIEYNNINDNKLSTGKFAWQQSASAFSVSKKNIDNVCKYILNQPGHHRKKSFEEEYSEFIKFYQKTINP